MMYNQKLAIAVKSHGRVLREHQDAVYLPFGCEYSLLIKNLNSVKASVKVEIDGTDIGDGQQFIINGNSEVELERFIKNGNLTQGNRFKFIERTSNIEDNRGIKVDDGLIRVSFQFEKVLDIQKVEHHYHYHHDHYRYYPPYYWGWDDRSTFISNQPLYTGGPVPCGSNSTVAYSAGADVLRNAKRNITAQNVPVNDAGITVPGSLSDQTFTVGRGFTVEDQVHVMVLRMLGETETGRRVEQPITVNVKPKCTTCGRVNKANAKFCQECGTALQIV